MTTTQNDKNVPNRFIMTHLANCQLFSKSVAFDHPQYQVRAHVLLLTDGQGGGRKLCFNTYNGSLGTTAKELPLEAFLVNDAPADQQCPWSYFDDSELAEAKLQKKGYRHNYKVNRTR